MITCKEDLYNTQILGNGALECQRLAFEFGIGWNEIGTDLRLRPNYIGVTCKKYGNHYELASIMELSSEEGTNTLTINDLKIKDLKPTQTKFVKVKESIFDLKKEFERGELYSSDCEGHYTQLKCEKKLYLAAHQDSVYRQVEIDWRDEVKEVYDAVELPVGEQGSLYMGEDWDEQEFIKFCHLVASLTEKPEGV